LPQQPFGSINGDEPTPADLEVWQLSRRYQLISRASTQTIRFTELTDSEGPLGGSERRSYGNRHRLVSVHSRITKPTFGRFELDNKCGFFVRTKFGAAHASAE
jgi:hypothetical protein